MAHKKLTPRETRKVRIRKKIAGSAERPRFVVFKSNRFLYAQIINDDDQKTLVAASSIKEKKGSGKTAAAFVGSSLAEKAREKKIARVVFDRNGYKYHGLIKEIADAARSGGLQF